MPVDKEGHEVPVPYFVMPSKEMIKYFNNFFIDTNFHDLPVNTHYKLYPQPSRSSEAFGSFNIYSPTAMRPPRQSFWAIEYYHAAMARGEMSRTIIVSPQALPVGWYADSKDGPRPLATIMSHDLVQHIDATYRTIVSREARWIEGFSMGGYGTLHLGFRYPELYGALSMIAGALLPRLDMEPLERTGDTFFNGQEYYEANHPTTLLQVNGDKIKSGQTLVRLLGGSGDTRLAEAIARMKKCLVELEVPFRDIEVKNVAHEYGAILEGTGSYSYDYWKEAAARIPQNSSRTVLDIQSLNLKNRSRTLVFLER
ncbi:hypothetical protein LTS07_001829 [Exophiala sideris]|uniref:Esterase n=1 Tax=Exophiala sideris TaxID=1016849 RepID=A0ABR0JPF8_9EURO|nr:hypothetical protein LTS07_001829 [Exophiala sideris]KAK5044343.1 hypothetical protein LTR13_000699 [Exophiala sideris]KAK5067843.1 hypothetical protein LTR69_001832 [Exophiala sideris]KAK5183915.1 hypothetical protein LTR44_003420 [Eurotiomycetes sp. CCFEE 6388]